MKMRAVLPRASLGIPPLNRSLDFLMVPQTRPISSSSVLFWRKTKAQTNPVARVTATSHVARMKMCDFSPVPPRTMPCMFATGSMS